MPRARATKDQQLRARMEVLALDAVVPRPSNYQIAKSVSQRLGRPVAPSTVRYIIKVFGKREEVFPEDRKRPGRPQKTGLRFKRCDFWGFTYFLGTLHPCLIGRLYGSPKRTRSGTPGQFWMTCTSPWWMLCWPDPVVQWSGYPINQVYTL